MWTGGVWCVCVCGGGGGGIVCGGGVLVVVGQRHARGGVSVAMGVGLLCVPGMVARLVWVRVRTCTGPSTAGGWLVWRRWQTVYEGVCVVAATSLRMWPPVATGGHRERHTHAHTHTNTHRHTHRRRRAHTQAHPHARGRPAHTPAGKFGEWRFDKRSYAVRPPPRNLSEPPAGMKNELVRHLIHAINEATSRIPGALPAAPLLRLCRWVGCRVAVHRLCCWVGGCGCGCGAGQAGACEEGGRGAARREVQVGSGG